MKPVLALISAALLATGCGAAAVDGGAGSSPSTAPADSPVSHQVDPTGPSSLGGAALVTPVPGTPRGTAVLPVGLRVWSADGGHAWARVTWWGGVPECYVLRPVRFALMGSAVRLRLFEASAVPVGTACIDLAMAKAVKVDLGPLAPGTYTVRAGRLQRTLVVGA